MSNRFTARRQSNQATRLVAVMLSEFQRGRPRSPRIYDQGALEVQTVRPLPHYRFEGVLTDTDWCISDVAQMWPEIDVLCDDVYELEKQRQAGKRNRQLRRRIEARAEYINSESMRPHEYRED